MSQKARIMYLLEGGPKTTRDFVRIPELAAEYRRTISNLRKELRPHGQDIVAKKRDRGCWVYSLVNLEPAHPELFPEPQRTHAPPP